MIEARGRNHRRGVGRVVALAAMLLGGGFVRPRLAQAVEYEVYIDVDTEADLNDLRLTQQISDSTYETLLELMRQGTDLNTASREDLYALPNLSYEEVDRIIAYREDAGRIADPADLVSAGVLSEPTLASLAAFLRISSADTLRPPTHGFVRYQGTYVAGDPRVPPMALQARVTTLGHLTVGAAALLDPRRLGPVRWDPNRQALLAAPDAPRPTVPKLFVQWDTEPWGVIAGTYRIGFGQRLTFDTSRRYTPNGIYLDDTVVARYDVVRLCSESAGELNEDPCAMNPRRGAPSFRISEGLQGIAAGAKHLPLGAAGWIQLYGFWSMQNHALYQYQLYNRGQCEDPTLDDPRCASVAVYKAQDDPAAATSLYRARTLPAMFDIITQGANLAWFYDDRTHVGLTGYGSFPRWRVEGVDLDLRPSARFPAGGPFGAVGADFSWGYRWADLMGEVSRSWDHTDPAGGVDGGFAGIVRHTASWDQHELEVSVRYYDPRYANPYSRPLSARDRYQGNQARDEIGGRVRYSAALAERVDLRTFADVWYRPTRRIPQLRAFARADVDATRRWSPGVWVEYQSQDLGLPRFVQCTDAEGIDDLLDRPITALRCGGQRIQFTGRSRFQPSRRLSFTLQYRHELQNRSYQDRDSSRALVDSDLELTTVEIQIDRLDSAIGDDLRRLNEVRQDINAFAALTVHPIDPLRLRARVRWYWDDIANSARREHSVWAYVEAQYAIRRWAIPTLRYDLYTYLDRRASTLIRQPNPEHWIRVQFESRF